MFGLLPAYFISIRRYANFLDHIDCNPSNRTVPDLLNWIGTESSICIPLIKLTPSECVSVMAFQLYPGEFVVWRWPGLAAALKTCQF